MTHDRSHRWPWIAGAALLVSALALLAWWLWAGDPRPTLSPTPTSWPRARMASPEYGMQAFLWWYPEIARRDMDLIHAAGFTWVKQHVAWRDIEPFTKGIYAWDTLDRIVADARQRGLNLLLRIDREPVWALGSRPDSVGNGPPEDAQDFGDFCHALASRYRGRVRAYQVWNEPNLAREWGGAPPNPAEYVDLLRACYIGVKTADPEALVISAGLAPTGNDPPEAMPDAEYLERMYEAGAAPYFDLLGVHAPGFLYPPEISPDDVAVERNGHRFFCFRHVEDLRAIMVRHGDGDKQVAVLEMGWTTDPIHPDYAWYAVTEAQQADYLVRAFRYARENWTPWIGLMVVHSIANPEWTAEDEQFWWAITEPGWPQPHLRPAYEALRDMEK